MQLPGSKLLFVVAASIMASTANAEALALALDPFSPSVIGTLVLVNSMYGLDGRVPNAIEQLQKIHGITALADDVGFVYEKLETAWPTVLHGVEKPLTSNPDGNLPEVPEVLLPEVDACVTCKRSLSGAQSLKDMQILTVSGGLQQRKLVELYCPCCNIYYANVWQFKLYDHRHVAVAEGRSRGAFKVGAHDIKLVANPAKAGVLVTLSRQQPFGTTVRDLTLLSGLLLHARGSFTSFVDVLSDLCGRPLFSDANHRKRMETLWFVYRLTQTLPEDKLATLTWEFGRDSFDQWLFQLVPSVRTAFREEWVIRHCSSCKICSQRFCFGLDGKRGAKRYICAYAGDGALEIPELETVLLTGCDETPVQGHLYCQRHGGTRSDADGTEDQDADIGEQGEVVDRRVRQELVVGSSAHAGLEYLVERNVAGEHVRAWLPAANVPEAVRKRYDEAQLKPQRPGRGKRVQPLQLSPEHPLYQENPADDECGIDKAAGHRNWKKKRLGGIVAAVNSCRLYLDWIEQHGGESTTLVYILLAQIVSFIRAHPQGKLPDAIWMDNACALRKYAQSPVRANRNELARLLSRLHYVLDVWHRANHTACLADPVTAAFIDPLNSMNRLFLQNVNTEACEQAFSWLDTVTYVALGMTRGRFQIFLYMMMHLANEKIMARRSSR